VDCCVTSPPYFGLRDYGHGDQIGLEGTPDAYVASLVQVFREVRRVLKDDGTVWLNLGSSYMSGGERTTGRNDGGRPQKGRGWAEYDITRTKIVSRGTDPIQSRQQRRVPACDTDDTALPDSTAAGSACSANVRNVRFRGDPGGLHSARLLLGVEREGPQMTEQTKAS
jgi:hypothetical protein